MSNVSKESQRISSAEPLRAEFAPSVAVVGIAHERRAEFVIVAQEALMTPAPLHEHVQEHIELIARHEAEFLARRTKSQKLADRIAAFVGSLKYVLMHFVLFAGWVGWNTVSRLAAHRFDPYPFPLLDLIFALEAIIVASFILIRQQRIGRRSEEREHLMLQVLLLTEREVTAVLAAEQQIAEHLGLQAVAKDKVLTQMSKETSIDDVAQVIQEKVIQETAPLE